MTAVQADDLFAVEVTHQVGTRGSPGVRPEVDLMLSRSRAAARDGEDSSAALRSAAFVRRRNDTASRAARVLLERSSRRPRIGRDRRRSVVLPNGVPSIRPASTSHEVWVPLD